MKWTDLRDMIASESGVSFIDVQKVLKAVRVLAQQADNPADVFKIVGAIMAIKDDE